MGSVTSSPRRGRRRRPAKVERWHKTLRREFLDGKVFDSIEDAQAQLDAWVDTYNHERPHQGIGMVAPWERFGLATAEPVEIDLIGTATNDDTVPVLTPSATRRVAPNGIISFASTRYMAGTWLAGEDVVVVCDAGLVQLFHRGVLIATHARRHTLDKQAAGLRRSTHVQAPKPSRRRAVSAVSVTRKVDSSGNVSFAGWSYRAGNKYRRRQIQVAVVGDTVELSIGEELIRLHPVRHDRTREHGALANPGGRPRRINAA